MVHVGFVTLNIPTLPLTIPTLLAFHTVVVYSSVFALGSLGERQSWQLDRVTYGIALFRPGGGV